MPENTPNLGLYLKNPVTDGNDTFNIETMLNQNWRKIDEKVALKTEVETSTSVQQKIDAAIAGLINGAPGALDTLKELADAMGDDPNFATTVLNRLTAAEQELDEHKADNVKHITSAERTAWNNAEQNAKAYTESAPEPMQRNLGRFSKYKSGKDSNGIFTIVEYKRADGTLYARSVLSGGTSPQYTTRTITYYAADGTTVIKTDPYTLIYDADGDLVGEVKQ